MSEPVRLHKKETNVSPVIKLSNIITAWVDTHALLCLFVIFAVLTALFIVLIYAIVGVSATESGTVYNQLTNIV